MFMKKLIRRAKLWLHKIGLIHSPSLMLILAHRGEC